MYGDLAHRTLPRVDMCHLTSTCVRAECVDVRRRTQCERGVRTTNNGATSVQMTVLEIMIAVYIVCPTCGMLAATRNAI